MYHFKLNGVECGCDTIEELIAVSTDNKIGPEAYVAWVGSAGEELDLVLEKLRNKGREAIGGEVKLISGPVKEQKATAKKLLKQLDGAVKARKKWKRSTSTEASTQLLADAKVGRKARKKRKNPGPQVVKKSVEEIASLPFVSGGVTWAVTNKIAKKLKRTDKAQLRSDLFARQKLPK
jgi:hypothetical protein